MTVEPKHQPIAEVVRLVGGYVDNAQPVPSRIRQAVIRARLIDSALAHLRLVKPVVLVSGFWRSGTTWLQECLAESLVAKTVFEPLSPLDPERRVQLGGRFLGDEDALQAFVPASLSEDDPTWALLEAAVTGRRGSNFRLSCRRDVAESLRRKVVVKDVRLQFNLPAIHRRFDIPVIHIRRHPCAVVASLLAANWHWSFERVRLSTLLPHLPARVVDRFDTDALSRCAASWALTEAHVSQSLHDEPWARLVSYEEMVDGPDATLTDLCRWMGLAEMRTAAFERPSASIDPADFAVPDRRRHDRWRSLLSTAEMERIETIVDELHPAWRRTWP